MIQIAKKLLLALLIGTSLNAATQLSQNEIKQIEELELFKRVPITVRKAYDLENFYLLKVIIQGNNDEVYLTKDKKNLIAGDVINTQSGAKLEAPADVSGLTGKEALTFGSGSDEYFLFTDPECPYCKKFESYFPQIEKNVKIRVFYYPLDFHKNAKDMSMYVMSKKTNAEKIKAMLTINVNDEGYKNRNYSEKELAQLEASLTAQMAIAQELDVRGTPAVFDKEGNKVSWPNMLTKYNVKQ
ncbi:thioredoxin fold domain-containing protein [Poseidonibacter ostreae]|uniref:Thioredoxin fold domain-containing protein n=1 Tax=Poseidonibacter ostreae TaxID=2654171 RepID=A0ABQ6VLV9_9BACT|nr:thioredoxin fold domain-containing protein [Poseidonibacter ostreae]KAB7891590.1 thioredoxin fold domain-containing protein [Poseidonibacter ostreae]